MTKQKNSDRLVKLSEREGLIHSGHQFEASFEGCPGITESRLSLACIRACLHSSCPENDGNEVDHRGEACIGFFVACRDASKRLDLAEEVFDEVAPLVLFRVMRRVVRKSLCASESQPRCLRPAKYFRNRFASNALSPMKARQAMPAIRTSKLVTS